MEQGDVFGHRGDSVVQRVAAARRELSAQCDRSRVAIAESRDLLAQVHANRSQRVLPLMPPGWRPESPP